jgi:RHS repeat-associated protein
LATANISRPEQGQSLSISASYSYDDAGFRAAGTVTTTVGSGSPTTTTTQYLTDINNPTRFSQVIEEHTNGSAIPSVSYVSGLSVLAQTNASGSTTYLMPDVEGSSRLVVDGSGNITARYAYDAFGSLLYIPVGILNPPASKVLYTGQQFDPTLLQYYLRARYYVPAAGRFTELDPISGDTRIPQTLHKYVYAGDNPVLYSDPGGKQFSLSGFLVNMAVGYVLSSLLRPVFQSVSYYLAKALLPPEYLEYFNNFNFSAFMVGLAGSGYIGGYGAVIGGTGGAEFLWSPRTEKGAFYTYEGGLLGVFGASSGGALTAKFGSVLALPSADDYAGPFLSLTFDLKALPQYMIERISKFYVYMAQVGVAVLQRMAISGVPLVADIFGQQTQQGFNDLLNKLEPTMKNLLKQIKNLSVSLFWDLNNIKPLGFDVEYNIVSKGSSGGLSLSITLYQRWTPDVPF